MRGSLSDVVDRSTCFQRGVARRVAGALYLDRLPPSSAISDEQDKRGRLLRLSEITAELAFVAVRASGMASVSSPWAADPPLIPPRLLHPRLRLHSQGVHPEDPVISSILSFPDRGRDGD